MDEDNEIKKRMEEIRFALNKAIELESRLAIVLSYILKQIVSTEHSSNLFTMREEFISNAGMSRYAFYDMLRKLCTLKYIRKNPYFKGQYIISKELQTFLINEGENIAHKITMMKQENSEVITTIEEMNDLFTKKKRGRKNAN